MAAVYRQANINRPYELHLSENVAASASEWTNDHSLALAATEKV
jgi:hypothetical protein